MAAPSTDRPVTKTVERLQERRPLPRTPRISVIYAVGWTITTLARVILGVVYFKDCPQQPNIPNYLLGLALITVLAIPLVILPCERHAAEPEEHLHFKACMRCLISLFWYTWNLAGAVWVFSVYPPNYDPAAADGVYCDKTLYTFAFWNAVWGTFVIVVHLCRGLLSCVMMSVAPTNRVVYKRVAMRHEWKDGTKVDVIICLHKENIA